MADETLKKFGENVSILYVEDEDFIREEVTLFLKKRFKRVFVGRNGEEGYELFLSNVPDIIVTDIRMPRVDGLKMIEMIRSVNESIPIIITSAFDEPKYLMRAIELNVDKYILKPISLKKLHLELEKCRKQISTNMAYQESLKLMSEYKVALDASSIVSKADKNGIITYVNDKFCEISGFMREELIGMPHNLVRHPEVSKDIFKELWDTILSGKIWRGRIKNQKKDGGFYIVETTVVPIFNSNNQISEFLSIRFDVTDFVKIGRELQQKEREKVEAEKRHLCELTKAKDSFLILFSHELKTPLNAIINLSSFAKRRVERTQIVKNEQDAINNMLNLVNKNGIDMLDIVTNILELSKIKSQKMSFTFTKFSLKATINEILERFSSLIQDAKADIVLDFYSDEEIVSDPFRFKQILSNLISNAIKYGKGKIIITLVIEDGKYVLDIEDNGDGVREKEKVFELFEQQDKDDLTRVAKGTGIGLHFVKLLCEELGIDIKIYDSEKLGGADMRLVGNVTKIEEQKNV